MNQARKISEHGVGENKVVKEIKNVLILAPFEELYSKYDLDSFCESIKNNLNVDPHLFKGDLADISKFKSSFLDNYDLIIFMTHGGRSRTGTSLLSGSSMYKSKSYWKKAVEDGVIPELRTGTPEGYEEDFLEMTTKFLNNASFDNTIVLAFACSSADRAFASPSMMSTFIEKGASYYCGFSNTSNTIAVGQFGQKGAQLAFTGLSLQDAFDHLRTNDMTIDVNQRWIQYALTYDKDVTQEDIDHYNLDLFDYDAKYDDCYMKSPFPHSLDAHQNNYSISLSWQSDLSQETLKYFCPDFEKEDFVYPEQTYKIRYDVYFNDELIASQIYDKEMMWDIEKSGVNKWYVVAKVINASTNEAVASFKSDENQFTVKSVDIPAEAIDLGLPSGTLWASYNVGATKREEYGSYFAWGETEEKDQYYFTNYSLSDGTVTSCHDIGQDISGTQYDVAHVRWGDEWTMPTKADFKELTASCKYSETTVNGVKGMQFTGPNGNSIFLPYTGYMWNTDNDKAGTDGSYWSATQTTNQNRAHELNFSKDEMLWDCYINRFAGLTVRPVKHVPAVPAEAIDLGLPSGTLWASYNIGATEDVGYGSYFAWGETEPKDWYSWGTYTHCDGSKDTGHNIGLEISGTQYDAARAKWGEPWQMPTADQINELVKNCQHEWTTYKGVNGTMVTGPNGKSIFLPAAGFMSGETLYYPGKYGLYKSGSLCDDGKYNESWLLNADEDAFVRVGIWNSTGHTIRPVINGTGN